ncbi:hypothetical protein BH10BAC4_BH10BAC4_25390 [soil metagenome]
MVVKLDRWHLHNTLIYIVYDPNQSINGDKLCLPSANGKSGGTNALERSLKGGYP